MAQKAKKDQAKANAATLKQLHICALTANGLFLAFNLFIRRRSIPAYILLSIPAFIAEFILERSGRPKYDPNTKALRNAGEDLAAPGLTEYLFDVVWITWISLVAVMVFGNWGWVIYSVVPLFAIYKGYGLLGMARGMMSGQSPPMAQEQNAGNGPARRTRKKTA